MSHPSAILRYAKALPVKRSAGILGSIACGIPEDVEEYVEEYVPLPVSIFGKGELYILRASGDSMIDAGIVEGERVYIVDNNNGERLDTYVIKGERGSGCICLNGAAARKVQVGDIVIIMSYALMDFEEAKTFQPKVVFPALNTNKLL